jgi:hypothetical protein
MSYFGQVECTIEQRSGLELKEGQLLMAQANQHRLVALALRR